MSTKTRRSHRSQSRRRRGRARQLGLEKPGQPSLTLSSPSERSEGQPLCPPPQDRSWAESTYGKIITSPSEIPDFLNLSWDIWELVLQFVSRFDRKQLSLVSRAARVFVLLHFSTVRLTPLWTFRPPEWEACVRFVAKNCFFVRKLVVPGSMATDACLNALPPSVRELSVECGEDVTSRTLSSLPPFLTTLRLSGCSRLGSEAAKLLPRSLQETDLSWLPRDIICRETVEELPRGLRTLDVSRCPGITDDALSFFPRQLEFLAMDRSNVSRLSFLPPRLLWLSARRCEHRLSELSLPGSLRFLDLSGNQVLPRPLILPASLRVLVLDFLPTQEELHTLPDLQKLFVLCPRHEHPGRRYVAPHLRGADSQKEAPKTAADIVFIHVPTSRFSLWNQDRTGLSYKS